MAWKSSFRQNYRTTFSPTVPASTAEISHVVADVEAPGGEKWEHLKSGGKQWQATPKNLPRMQRTRAIPVAWLNSGLCPDRPKGWKIIIIISIMNVCLHFCLSYSGFKAHLFCTALYCHLSLVWLYRIFHITLQRHDFGKKGYWIQSDFIILYIAWNITRSAKNSARYFHQHT